jgi:hypothetical protein
MKLFFSITIEHKKGLQHKKPYRAKRERFKREKCEREGENTLRGGHFRHFHNIYVKYIFAKRIAFDFGFYCECLGLIF